MPLTPGATFERYEIRSLIGRGGMGEVYRAIDTRLHRPVALKVLCTDKDASATVTEAGGIGHGAGREAYLDCPRAPGPSPSRPRALDRA